MTEQIFKLVVLRLPEEAFTEEEKKEEEEKEKKPNREEKERRIGILHATRDECWNLDEDAWYININDYWNYRDILKKEGRTFELGNFHQEIDRLYNSMKTGSSEAVKKFIVAKKLKKILSETRIKSPSIEIGSEGFSWLALAGLYVHFNILGPKEKKLKEQVEKDMHQAIENLLEGESGLAHAIEESVEGEKSQCILKKAIQKRLHQEGVYFTKEYAEYYFRNAGNYHPRTREFMSLKWEPENKAPGELQARKVLEAVRTCFKLVYQEEFDKKWKYGWEFEQEVVDEEYNTWNQIPENNKAQKNSDWAPYFIIKGEKYMPPYVKDRIAKYLNEYVADEVSEGIDWIRKKYFKEMSDAGLITKRLPIVALFNYLRKSFDNENLYFCFPGQCPRPSCGKDINPAVRECPICGKNIGDFLL